MTPMSCRTRSAVAGLSSLFVSASLVVGCKKSPPPPGKVVAIESLCSEPDHARVRIAGYVRYERGLFSSCSTFGGHKTCNLVLYAAPEPPPDFDVMHPSQGPEPLHARLSVPVGDGPGQMTELPDKFSASDVVVHLPNEATAREGGHVTIDGTVSVMPGDPKAPAGPRASCFINVDWAAGA
jgi:hypothetical protein